MTTARLNPPPKQGDSRAVVVLTEKPALVETP